MPFDWCGRARLAKSISDASRNVGSVSDHRIDAPIDEALKIIWFVARPDVYSNSTIVSGEEKLWGEVFPPRMPRRMSMFHR